MIYWRKLPGQPKQYSIDNENPSWETRESFKLCYKYDPENEELKQIWK
jgi:hypothetical protein